MDPAGIPYGARCSASPETVVVAPGDKGRVARRAGGAGEPGCRDGLGRCTCYRPGDHFLSGWRTLLRDVSKMKAYRDDEHSRPVSLAGSA